MWVAPNSVNGGFMGFGGAASLPVYKQLPVEGAMLDPSGSNPDVASVASVFTREALFLIADTFSFWCEGHTPSATPPTKISATY